MKRLLSIFLCGLIVWGLAFCAPQEVRAAGKKLLAITYDDGPGVYTSRLLDGLRARGVKATFFMMGKKLSANNDTVKRMYREGHQLANHSTDHPHLMQLPTDEAVSQIKKTNALLDQVCGKGTNYLVRPPYGDLKGSLAKEIGQPCILWSYAPKDWLYTDAQSIKNNIVKNAQDGAIILVHDTVEGTVDGTLGAIDELTKKGYEFVTVGELFRRRGYRPKNGSIYDDVRYNYCADPGPAKAPTLTGKEEPGGMRVTITGGGDGAPLYYVIDGEFGPQTKRYAGPFFAPAGSKVQACAAYDMNGSRSETVELTVRVSAPAPVLRAEEGFLTLDGDSSATVYYRLSGSQATDGDTVYTEPVALLPGTVISAWAEGEGLLKSAVVKGYYSENGNFFTDVFPDKWYCDTMDWAASRGLMKGVQETKFAPTDPVSRAQLAVLLYHLAGSPPVQELSPFPDVPSDAYYTQAAAWANSQGLMQGYEDGTFRPKRTATRQELSTVLYNYLRLQGKALPDAPAAYLDSAEIARWARPAVDSMSAAGILSGDPSGRFRPRSGCSRAEAASVLRHVSSF